MGRMKFYATASVILLASCLLGGCSGVRASSNAPPSFLDTIGMKEQQAPGTTTPTYTQVATPRYTECKVLTGSTVPFPPTGPSASQAVAAVVVAAAPPPPAAAPKVVAPPAPAAPVVTPAAPAAAPPVEQASASANSSKPVQITPCAARVIRTAIDQCVWNTHLSNLEAKIGMWGTVGLLAGAAATGPIALAAGASATTIALASSAASAGTSVVTSVQKEIPTTGSQPGITSMVTAAQSYLEVNNPGTDVSPSTTVTDPDLVHDYKSLWDAVLSACPSGAL